MGTLKTAAVTTSRADYGLLFPLLKRIAADPYFDLELIVTGSHLSARHGNTIELIQKDGINITATVDMVTEGDKENDICRSISAALRDFSEVLKEMKPDFIIVLGDRYELWPVCIAAVVYKVPIVHIHGGEATFGAIDDSIRHSITKMASIHFPCLELYAKRIIQMGEYPKTVFPVGALGIDNIKSIELMTLEQLSQFSGVDFNKDVALMTYHPVTLDHYDAGPEQITEILEAVRETSLFTLVTMPNCDTGGDAIYKIIEKYVTMFPQRFKMVKSLGQKAYLSAMNYAKIMIGNSSSGIIESASYKIPVVNVGDRQLGRFKPQNVIDCECSKASLADAIEKAVSVEFRKSISNISNPYGDGNTAFKIIEVLKTIDFSDKSKLIKKGFYDLNYESFEMG